MPVLRKSTARTILIGPVLDADGVAKTDEVVANIRLTKNGTVAAASGSTITHDHAGKYKLALSADDTDTVGVLQVSLDSGTNDMPVREYNVVEQSVFDALFAAGAGGYAPAATALSNVHWTTARAGYLDQLNIGGETLAHTGNANTFKASGFLTTLGATAPAGWITSASFAAGAITSTAIADGAVASSKLGDVTLADGAHGGASASITLNDYSDFQGAASDPWSAVLPGSYSAGSAGHILGTNLDAKLTDRTLESASYFDPAHDTVARVTLVDACTANTDMRGTDNAALASTALSNVHWTTARAGYLDQLNIGGETLAHTGNANTFKASGFLTTLGATAPAGWITSSAFAASAITSAAIADGAVSSAKLGAVTLADGAHGGSSATITLSDYSDFQGAAGDPWETALPGSYSAGTAGHILGAEIAADAATAAGATAGSGDLSIAIIVQTDDQTPIAGASVTVYTQSGIRAAGPRITDTHGHAAGMAASAGSYRANVTAFGYIGRSLPFETAGDGTTLTVTLTADAPVGSDDPEFAVVYADVYDANGQLEPGIICSLRISKEPLGSGQIFDGAIAEATSDAQGRVTWPNRPVGAEIEYWRGPRNAPRKRIRRTIISPEHVTGGTYQLPRIVGHQQV